MILDSKQQPWFSEDCGSKHTKFHYKVISKIPIIYECRIKTSSDIDYLK